MRAELVCLITVNIVSALDDGSLRQCSVADADQADGELSGTEVSCSMPTDDSICMSVSCRSL